MKKIALGLLLCSPAFCGLFDDAYWIQQLALMSKQLQQAQQIYSTAMQYKQMAENAAAFIHNPAAFLGQTAMIEQMALNTAAGAGVTTQKRAEQLQKIIALQQAAMQEAQQVQTISHSNMANMGLLANNMVDTTNQLAAVQQQLQNEQRTAYYQQSQQYRPQSGIIAAWRLKP